MGPHLVGELYPLQTGTALPPEDLSSKKAPPAGPPGPSGPPPGPNSVPQVTWSESSGSQGAEITGVFFLVFFGGVYVVVLCCVVTCFFCARCFSVL